VICLERSRGYWVTRASGRREESVFKRIVTQVWNWAQACPSIRGFTEGERRYGKELWKLASVWLKRHSWTGATTSEKPGVKDWKSP